MPFQPFTASEVRYILKRSTAGGGHAGERHAAMSRDALWQRVVAYKGSGLAARTSFLNFSDLVDTLLAVLNDPRNDAELERFRVSAKASDKNHFELKNIPLPTAVRMHYGMGGQAAVFPCNLATLVLHKDLALPRGMRVVTFFGTMGNTL